MTSPTSADSPPQPGYPRYFLESLLVFALFFVAGGSLPPEVNEAHYLSKARHYWDPAWAANDHFLESADTHLVFYAVFGWLTKYCSLTTVAWLGRLVTWLLMALAWCRLSWRVLPVPWLSLLSAGLFHVLLTRFHLAGEWVIGGLEAKGMAYVLLFLAIDALLQKRWQLVWPLLGLASSFHVLVGGWSVLAALFVWATLDLPQAGNRVSAALRMVPSLLLGLLLALPGLWPALRLNEAATAEQVAAAHWIYVHERLPHHLVFHRLPLLFHCRFLGMSAVWLGLAWLMRSDVNQRRLSQFVFAALVLCGIGILIDLITLQRPELSASLLRYYWFRLSDAMVPLGAAFGLLGLAWKMREFGSRYWLIPISAVLAVVFSCVTADSWARFVDERPPAIAQSFPRGETAELRSRRFHDWQRACEWIAGNTAPGTVVLTPRHQQGFKWYASRAEVVNWKDIPQNDVAIVEWKRRLQEVYPGQVVWRGLAGHGAQRLHELSQEFGFEYVLIDRTRSQRGLPFVRVFPIDPLTRSVYEVYRIREEDLPTSQPRGASEELQLD